MRPRLETWRRNQYVMVATVFVVFTGFAFVLPFLPLYVRELGVESPDDAVLWAGVLIGISPLLAGLLGAGYRIDSMTLVDLFPQTYHLETVARLVHRSASG